MAKKRGTAILIDRKCDLSHWEMRCFNFLAQAGAKRTIAVRKVVGRTACCLGLWQPGDPVHKAAGREDRESQREAKNLISNAS